MSVPPSNPLMGMAVQSMQNPNAQAVPPAMGSIDAGTHPVIASILKALAGGMQSFGSSGMGPQERVQRQQMEQEKAQAMAQLSQGQQGLGIKQQEADTATKGQQATAAYQTGELGLGQQRATTESEAQKATAAHQTGTLAETTRKNTADIAHQQAEDEYNQSQLKQRADQLNETVRNNKANNTIEQNRTGIEAQMAQIAASRVSMEEKHFEQTATQQGQALDRNIAEDERKSLLKTVDDFYAGHTIERAWKGMGQDSMMKQKDIINDHIDQKYHLNKYADQSSASSAPPADKASAKAAQQNGGSGGQRQAVFQNGKQIGWTTDGKTMTQ